MSYQKARRNFAKELAGMDGPRPTRAFVVYPDLRYHHQGNALYQLSAPLVHGWRWRLVSTGDWRVIAESVKAYSSSAKAKQAVRRESAFYREGAAIAVLLRSEECA